MLTVAIFHAGHSLNLPTVSSGDVPVDSDLTHGGMVDLAFRSATLFHPDCRKVLLTDETTEFAELTGAVEIMRRSLDPSKLMLERKVSQVQLLQQPDMKGSDVLMLDADMLMNAPVTNLFGKGMTLGLSYRDKPGMPLNGGLIAVSGKGRAGAIKFFGKVIELMERNAYDDLGAYRDQHALMEAIGHDRFEGRASNSLDLEGIGRVVFWPCATHNYTPPDRDGSVFFRDPRCRFVHFKGARKRLMRRYWETHLAEREMTSARASWWRR